jgi:transcriptional regulator with XRE-family HTH domain
MKGDLQQAIGRNVRAHRHAREINQEDFADILGIHRTYMGAIERGERNLSLEKVEWLADQLGVEPMTLLRD